MTAPKRPRAPKVKLVLSRRQAEWLLNLTGRFSREATHEAMRGDAASIAARLSRAVAKLPEPTTTALDSEDTDA